MVDDSMSRPAPVAPVGTAHHAFSMEPPKVNERGDRGSPFRGWGHLGGARYSSASRRITPGGGRAPFSHGRARSGTLHWRGETGGGRSGARLRLPRRMCGAGWRGCPAEGRGWGARRPEGCTMPYWSGGLHEACPVLLHAACIFRSSRAISV
jgi:hypothetical protein